ncbi:MAG: hypothetical protein FJ267_05725, partial [Planctomycetes bacterium]|nr:hypothetical protein [Planctomycetota bacterium]
QGRFGSVLVEEDVHAQTLSRYVHLNPYRAGLDLCPGQYAWSSYRYYLDPLGAPTWLDWHTILAELCQREGAARIAYRRFVESGMRAPQKNPLDDVVDGWLLGSKTFIERYQDVPERRQALPNSELAVDVDSFEGTVARPISNSEAPDPCVILTIVAQAFDVDPEDLVARGRHRNRARLAALWLCRERIHESLVELGKRFGGLSPSTVSEALCEASRLRVVEDSFGEKLRKIERVLDGTEGAGSGTSEFGIGR